MNDDANVAASLDTALVADSPVRSRRAPVSASSELLASHDAALLAAKLERAGASPHAAQRSTAAVLRHAFNRKVGDLASDAVADSAGRARWDDATLEGLGIARALRPALLSLDPHVSLRVIARAPSVDGTLRLVLAARDGGLLESVLIPGPRRTTLCISSQVGCARACSFCETGRLGLERQLAAGEIVDQVRVGRALAAAAGMPPLQNVVFMGMGEPFDNLDAVLVAIRLLTDPRAFALTPSRVTVSTVGVADKLKAFFAGARAELAVSLNAPDDGRRSSIMPVNRRWGLAELRRELIAALPRGRRVFLEYVLFDGWNDSDADADLLAAFVGDLPARVNVIPCNPGPDPALRPPPAERVDAFVARLMSHGLTTLVRRPRGRDIGGACGQLAGAARDLA